MVSRSARRAVDDSSGVAGSAGQATGRGALDPTSTAASASGPGGSGTPNHGPSTRLVDRPAGPSSWARAVAARLVIISTTASRHVLDVISVPRDGGRSIR